MLLKTTGVKSVIRAQGRWIPERVIYKDILKTGEGTEFIVDAIELDAAIDRTTPVAAYIAYQRRKGLRPFIKQDG